MRPWKKAPASASTASTARGSGSPRREGASLRVIEVKAGSLATGASTEPARLVDGAAAADVSRDLLKLAVVERHRGTGNVGVAFARGFGLKRGAIASSVAHDSHNVVVVGADDASMETAVRRVAAIGGGVVVADGAQALAEVALPVAGLMSNAPMADVDAAERRANEAAHALGGTMDHPFMTLAFLALPVIPELKLTDKGLVDVGKFDFVSRRRSEDDGSFLVPPRRSTPDGASRRGVAACAPRSSRRASTFWSDVRTPLISAWTPCLCAPSAWRSARTLR